MKKVCVRYYFYIANIHAVQVFFLACEENYEMPGIKTGLTHLRQVPQPLNNHLHPPLCVLDTKDSKAQRDVNQLGRVKKQV